MIQLLKKGKAMQKTVIGIPHYKTLSIKHIVLDYNGTLAKDGVLTDAVTRLLPQLSEQYEVHVITADTFGSVHKQVAGFNVSVKVISSDDHTAEKADYVATLGSETCVAVGNGNNDQAMLRRAVLGIALLGDEGCATETLLASDICCKSIENALELCLNTKRLIATLRA